MKQWVLPKFVLDLSELWKHPEAPDRGDEAQRSLVAWRDLKRQFADGTVGFFDLPDRIDETTLGHWAGLASRLRAEFEGAVVIGIGGSHLGAHALISALGAYSNSFPLYWVTQPDPEVIREIAERAKSKRLATVVISKSGNSTETLSAFYHLSRWLSPEGYVAITDSIKGELRQLAMRENWTALEVPANIGGRFSVLSVVGLFPAMLAGVSVVDVLKGAGHMRDALIRTSASAGECPAFAMAGSHYWWDTAAGRGIHYFMPYRMSLRPFAEWYVQLFGESLGKRSRTGARVGFTPVAAVGPTDQHSLVQLFNEGPKNKMVGLMDVKEKATTAVGKPRFEAGTGGFLTRWSFEELAHQACSATQTTLRANQVPCYRLIVEGLSAETMGSLFFFFETVCALAGQLYQVNPYDQPGVEEGKRLFKDALTRG